MKTLVKILCLSVLLNINLIANSYYTEEEKSYIKSKEFKVAMLPSFVPFSFKNNDKLSGYSYDILELISKKSGLTFKYEVDNWSKNIEKFKNKEVDLIDSISFKQSRLPFTNFTKAYFEIPLVIFSRKDLYSYDGNLNSLIGKKLGNTKNIFYKKQIEELELFEIKEYDSFDEKLKALAFGEVDIILGHLFDTQMAIQRNKYINIKVLGNLDLPNLKSTDLRFGVVKEDVLLYSIIQKSLRYITKKEWQDLYDKWIGIYIDKEIDYGISDSLSKTEKDFLTNHNDFDCVIADTWSPFKLKGNNVIGMAIDYWEVIKKNSLIRAECRVVKNFDEVLSLIKTKKADITISTSMTEEKLKYAKFSKPYLSYPIAVATTNDKRYISKIATLSGKKVAVSSWYSFFELLEQKYPDIKFVEVKDTNLALKLLSEGDVYAVIDILPILSHMIGRYNFDNIKISGLTEFNFDVRIMVRDDLSELVSIINKGINKVSKKEEHAIKNKWLSVKYENITDYSKFLKMGFISLIIILILIYRQYILNRHNKQLQEANNEIEKKTKELAKQKELFEKIYYESSDGIFLYDIHSKKIIDSNEVSFNILGYENKDSFFKLELKDFFPPFQPDNTLSLDKINERFRMCLLKGSDIFEMVYKKADNSLIWLEVVTTFLIINNKDIIHIVLRDIHNRKKMEEKLNILTHKLEERVEEEVRKNEEKTRQLIQQNRLAQMGEMISMIAHQWRQPLAAISATTNNIMIKLLIGDEISKSELQDEINLISNYSHHLSMTIDDFRNFFKTDKEKTNVTLEEIINSSILIMKSSLDSNYIKVNLDLNCNSKMYLYTNEVSQVILNILKNAEDALLEKKVENPLIKIKTYEEDSFAIVKISDNAGGVPEKIIDKIFDPYFSTKKNKEGTGIGLYMSKMIINEHCNGFLSVTNNKDGATFKIKFKLEQDKEDFFS